MVYDFFSFNAFLKHHLDCVKVHEEDRTKEEIPDLRRRIVDLCGALAVEIPDLRRRILTSENHQR